MVCTPRGLPAAVRSDHGVVALSQREERVLLLAKLQQVQASPYAGQPAAENLVANVHNMPPEPPRLTKSAEPGNTAPASAATMWTMHRAPARRANSGTKKR